jgi:hypothetical protein
VEERSYGSFYAIEAGAPHLEDRQHLSQGGAGVVKLGVACHHVSYLVSSRHAASIRSVMWATVLSSLD